MPAAVPLRCLASLVVLLALGPWVGSAHAATYELDPSFGAGGRVVLADDLPFLARAVVPAPGGGLLVAGSSCQGTVVACAPAGASQFQIARLTADGRLDAGFGRAGVATSAFPGSRAEAFDLVVQPDGGIVAGGVAATPAGEPGDFALARFTAAGAPDPGFGNDGLVTTPAAGFAGIADLEPGPGGSIVAAGPGTDGGLAKLAVARYSPAGGLDGAFGAGGTAYAAVPGREAAAATGAAIDTLGRITTVGFSATAAAPAELQVAAARMSIDGQLDPGFGRGGIWSAPLGEGAAFANGAAALPAGRTLAWGSALASRRWALAVVRFDAAGRPDPAWSGDGLATSLPGQAAAATEALEEGDGGALAVGYASAGAGDAFALARFDASGAADGPAVLTSFPAHPIARASAAARLPDGRVIAVGVACAVAAPDCAGGVPRLAVARYVARPPEAPPERPAPLPPPPGAAPARPSPAGLPELPRPVAPARFATVVGPRTLVADRRGRVKVAVRCAQPGGCRVRLALETRGRGDRVGLAGRRATLPAGASRTLTLRLTGAGGRLLRRSAILPARLTLSGRDTRGAERRVTRSVSLRRAVG